MIYINNRNYENIFIKDYDDYVNDGNTFGGYVTRI